MYPKILNLANKLEVVALLSLEAKKKKKRKKKKRKDMAGSIPDSLDVTFGGDGGSGDGGGGGE